MKIKELLKYAEADMEVLNMEPSKIWGWDDGTICVEAKING